MRKRIIQALISQLGPTRTRTRGCSKTCMFNCGQYLKYIYVRGGGRGSHQGGKALDYRDSITSFPKWITPALTNLADLCICLTEMTQDGLVTLGKLPSLLHLRLSLSKKFVGTVQATYFPNLKVLNFIENVYVSFVKGSAPKLEEMSNMPFSVSAAKANKFYLGIHHLPCLKRAYIQLDDKDTTPLESKAAAAAIRKEACINPNHLAVTISEEPHEEDNEETCGSEEEKSKD